MLKVKIVRETPCAISMYEVLLFTNKVWESVASFPGLSREGEGKAWGLLCAHAQQLPEKVVIGYYSKLSVTLVSILSV